MKILKFILILSVVFIVDMIFPELGNIFGKISVQVVGGSLGNEQSALEIESAFYAGKFLLILFLAVLSLRISSKGKIFTPITLSAVIKNEFEGNKFYQGVYKFAIFILLIVGPFILASTLDFNNTLYNYKGFDNGREARYELYKKYKGITPANIRCGGILDKCISYENYDEINKSVDKEMESIQSGVSIEAIMIFLFYAVVSFTSIKLLPNIFYFTDKFIGKVYSIVRVPLSIIFLGTKRGFSKLEEIEKELKSKK